MPLRAACLLAAALSARLAATLFVSPDSPCSKFCGNVQGSTATDELACDAGTLQGTPTGVVWQQCIKCLLTSTHVADKQSDLQALLYNLRYSTGHCLFGGATNPCVTSTACEPFKDAVTYQNMTTSAGALDYCKRWDPGMIDHCSACLVPLEQSDVDGLSQNNYMTILEAACEQKPKPGSTVSIDGNVFGPEPIIIVPPEVSYVGVPSPDYGPVSLGARVGIAFGGLALILAIVGFCIVFNGKRRRRAFLRELERRHGGHGGPGWPHPKTRYGGNEGQDMFETPVSQQPLRGWENGSPVTPHSDAPFPRYFSPYSSQYNSPVTGPDGSGPSNAQWPTIASNLPTQQQFDQIVQLQSPAHGSPPPAFTQWPTVSQEKMVMQMHSQPEKGQNEMPIGVALGGDEASLRSKASNLNLNGYPIESKGKGREDEAYEMHEVESPYATTNGDVTGRQYEYPYRMPAEPQAPVLHHPGYGRHHGSRPGSGGTGGVVATEGWRMGEYGAGQQAQRGFTAA